VESGNASAGDNIFQNGDLIRISSQDGVDNPSGETEFIRLDATTGVSWNGDKATLTFDTGATLANTYTAANTRVGSVIEATNIESPAKSLAKCDVNQCGEGVFLVS
jgi:hypothetical protein